MNFAPFTPYEEEPIRSFPPPTPATQPPPVNGSGSIESLVKQLGPSAKKLRSDYLMTSVFYYIPETNTVMQIETVHKYMRKANSDVEDHLRTLNGISRMR